MMDAYEHQFYCYSILEFRLPAKKCKTYVVDVNTLCAGENN